MTYEDVEVGDPGPGEVRIRNKAIGVNYIDTYFRTGMYPSTLPVVLGNEAAGEVVAVGEGVRDLKRGDRVAYVITLRRLFRRADRPGQVGRQAARRRLRRDRRRHDAEGHDGAIPPASHLQGQTRRHDPLPRRGGRRRLHRLPMGEASRRHRDRHRGLARQGEARARERLRPRHPLPRRGFRRARQGDHRRARYARWSTTASARRRSRPRSIA